MTSTIGDEADEMGNELEVVDLGSDFVAIQIVTGMQHNCALSAQHQVKCWGANLSGQLGLEDTNFRGNEYGTCSIMMCVISVLQVNLVNFVKFLDFVTYSLLK